MKKETKISAPNGCEIEKVEIVDGVAVVTFKEKEQNLPKSWEEFCEMFPIKDGECVINPCCNVTELNTYKDLYYIEQKRGKRHVTARNIFPDRATAEAVLALCQLIQLRDAYNGDLVPDWKDNERKYTIDFFENDISIGDIVLTPRILYFKSEELRDEFLLNFRVLIEKLKPLYGIKEGGEE